MSILSQLAHSPIVYSREGFRCRGRFVSEREVETALDRGWAFAPFGGKAGIVRITNMGRAAALLRKEGVG